LAERLGVTFVELDALVHGPDWAETPDAELRALVEPVVRSDGWVIDGVYHQKLGSIVLDAADVVVWLDLPLRVWIPRLLRRSGRRIAGRQPLWNENRETLGAAVWGRESLLGYGLRTHLQRRRAWPSDLAAYRVVRLRSPAAVQRWLEAVPAAYRPADAEPGSGQT
jgi:hypothetical protein